MDPADLTALAAAMEIPFRARCATPRPRPRCRRCRARYDQPAGRPGGRGRRGATRRCSTNSVLGSGLKLVSAARRRPAILDITCSANIGVSWTRKRNLLRSITASLVSVTATAVPLRGEESMRAISPNVSSGPSLRTAPLDSRTSTSPSTTPNISVPLAPSSKITVPARHVPEGLGVIKQARNLHQENLHRALRPTHLRSS